MGFDRKLARKAELRARRMVYIPTLNYPGLKLEVPRSFRSDVLRENGLTEQDLVGKTPFHAVFVVEGLAFIMLSRVDKNVPLEQSGVAIFFHLVQLDNAVSRELVGSEICKRWEDLQEVLTFDELKLRYEAMTGGLN